MDLKTGYPFWLIKNGLPFNYKALDKNLKTDAVIIGGGISGALAAYFLSNKGINCVVLDKRTIGLGSTCASTSLVQYELDKPLFELEKLVGEQRAEEVYLECVNAVNSLGKLCNRLGFKEAEKIPSLYYAASAGHQQRIEKEFKARNRIGIDVKLLGQKQVKKNYGFNAVCAIESSCGLSVNVYTLVHALCKAAAENGLQVYDRTEVVNIRRAKKSFTVHTEDHHINCRYIVNATGYEAGNFIKHPLCQLQSTYAIVSEHYDAPDSFWKNRAMLWNTADPYLYMRLTQDNRIIVGGRDEEIFNAKRRDQLIAHKSKLLKKDFNKLFPEIKFKTEFSWTGTFAVTKDAMPYIGALQGQPNIFYALGYGGNGILFSYIAAKIISDSIIGKKNKATDWFKFNRN